MKRLFKIGIFLALQVILLIPSATHAQNERSPAKEERPLRNKQRTEKRPSHDKRNPGGDTLPMPSITWPEASLIVTRPTATTADINILPRKNGNGILCYQLDGKTGTPLRCACSALSTSEPEVVHLTNLSPNARYRYWLEWENDGKSPVQTFQTQRSPGSSFQFFVQGDSHPERSHQHTPALYEQALKRIALEKPDFFIALGDDFSVDTLREITPAAVETIYRMQREYLGFIGAQAALFLVNGNHEQAARCNLDGTPNNVAVWAQNTRERYFSQPAPHAIYSGDEEKIPHIGLLRDYYAWEWGDALFVVIDPYWHSPAAVDNMLGSREKSNDEWNSTLGDAQYQWLKRTLEASRAPFNFVFTHHVLGRGRGGIECASRGEWGGNDRKGSQSFVQRRPGWSMPIHPLLVSTHVTILFQGHDHLFGRQELDGVIYQTCPLPAGFPDSKENFEAYRSGTSVPGAGFLRVTVQPENVKVDFVRNILPSDRSAGSDGSIAFSYTQPPARK